MIVGEECRADEHKQCPDGYGHQHADVGGLLGFMVVLGGQVTLYDGLVGAVLLQGIEDAVEHHHDEGQLREIPVVRAKVDLVVFRGNAKGLGRSTFNTEHQDTDADNAATNEQESLCYIHPYDGLHAAKQRQDDDGDAQHQDNAVDVDVEERRQCHRDKKEHRACLRKVA